MKTLVKKINAYYFNELSKEAQEKVIEDYKSDDFNQQLENDLFYEDIKNTLNENFSNSDLDVTYSLSYCQGDGLNIYGKLNLYDFLKLWDATEKEKNTIKFYLEYINNIYDFESNHHYSYNCKFIDKKYINDTIQEAIENLQYYNIKNIKIDIVKKFYNDMIDYFSELDSEYEKEGYSTIYFDYDGANKNIASTIIDNEWMYDINGNFICDFEYEEAQQ